MAKIPNVSSVPHPVNDLFCMIVGKIFIPLCVSLPSFTMQLCFYCSQAYKFPVGTGNLNNIRDIHNYNKRGNGPIFN